VKAVFLLGCYGCIFHGTGNSAQLCQNFGISEGVWTPQTPPSVRHWLLLSKGNEVCVCVCIFINDIPVSIDYCLTFDSIVDYSCTFKCVDFITTMQMLKKHWRSYCTCLGHISRSQIHSYVSKKMRLELEFYTQHSYVFLVPVFMGTEEEQKNFLLILWSLTLTLVCMQIEIKSFGKLN